MPITRSTSIQRPGTQLYVNPTGPMFPGDPNRTSGNPKPRTARNLPTETGVGEVVEGRDDGGKVVERVVLARALQGVVFEDGGDGDLGAVQGVLDQPPAALRAVDAALRLGVHHPPAGAGIEGQVDTDSTACAPRGRGACARGWRGACAVAAAIAGAGDARRGVGMPARVLSLAAVPIHVIVARVVLSPGVRSSARRLREVRRAGRPIEGVPVGRGAPRGVSVEAGWEGVPVADVGLRSRHQKPR